ncbi:MAG: hypothetical protein J3Q66DRAFT_354479 [Benniella sp.]|nr:MAG: hypothetical protein J3Q66DRAFT_354479 [Benniella sp.]
MFEKLAPTLNGANFPSKSASRTPAIGTNQTTGLTHAGTKVLTAASGVRTTPLNNTAQQRTNPSGSGLLPQHPNPFARGFSGLRSDNTPLSTVSTLAPNKPSFDQKVSSTDTVKDLRNTASRLSSERSTHVHAHQGDTSGILQAGGKQPRPMNAFSAPAIPDGDISFGADDFLIGSDDLALADLMDDLNESTENSSLPLSWTPTPPRKVVSTAPPSQTSQLSQSSQSSQPLRPTTLSQPIITSTANALSKAHTTLNHSRAPQQQQQQQQPSIRSSSPIMKSGSVSRVGTTAAHVNKTPAKIHSTGVRSKPLMSRPEEHDTIDHRNMPQNQKIPNPIVEIQDNERRSLLRSNSSPSTGRNASADSIRSKRRLPGPAGNLPILSAEEKEQLFRSRGVPFAKDTRISGNVATSPNSSIKKRIQTVHKGPIDSMFANGAWDDMLRTFKLPDYKPSTLQRWKGTAPMIKYSISDIERSKELHRGKVPNLVAMIKDVVLSEIDAAVTLLDPSGEMRGTVHRTVLEQYKNNEIRIGTVLALQNVSVFSPRTASHYLIITLRNIAGIFQPHPPSTILSQGSSQDRLSQKKKKTSLDSQDSQEGESSRGRSSEHGGHTEPVEAVVIDASPVSKASNHSGGNLSRQSSYNDWSDISFNHSLSQEGERKDVKAAPPSPYKKQKQAHPNPGSGIQGSLYIHEINFQSLQPTFGGSSMIPVQETRPQNNHVTATPLIPLGVSTQESPSAITPALSGRSLLASFAAPASLRKRSSSSTSSMSQKTNSAGSTSQQLPLTGKESRVSASPPSPNTSRAGVADISNLSDWPDDFGEADFSGILEEDLNALADPPSDQIKQQHDGSNVAKVPKDTLLPNPALSSQRNVDDDEDDLDGLLDGLDDAELYDL